MSFFVVQVDLFVFFFDFFMAAMLLFF